MSERRERLSPLPKDVQAVVDIVRAAGPEGPPAATRERTRARLLASLSVPGGGWPLGGEGALGPQASGQVGAGAAPAAGSSTVGAGAGASVVASKAVLWVVATVGATGMIGGGAWLWHRASSPRPPVAAPAAVGSARRPPDLTIAGDQRPLDGDHAERPATASPRIVPPTLRRRHRHHRVVRSPTVQGAPRRERRHVQPPSAARGASTTGLGAGGSAAIGVGVPPEVIGADRSTLALERQLLAEARTALSERALERARRAIADHRARFPRGQLVEEREALAIRLLLAGGDHRAAREAVARFRARYPHSILLSDLGEVP